MAKGKTFKQCGCRDGSGTRLGQGCPKLRRAGGAWSRDHGTWYYQLELPPHRDGTRRNPLRRGGYSTREDADDFITSALELLAVARNDRDLEIRIADLVVETVKDTGHLPDAETVRKKIRNGQDLSCDLTVGDWLDRWLQGKRKLRESSASSYSSHVRLYLRPHLGHLRLTQLSVTDVAVMFEAIDEFNDTLQTARTSDDPALRAAVKGRRHVSPATCQRIRATLRAALNTAIKQRFIDINAASLIELPSGDRPDPLIWTAERVAQWSKDRDDYVTTMTWRKTTLAAASPYGAKLGHRVTAISAYIGTPRPSPVMVWTPDQTMTFLDRACQHRLYLVFRLIAYRGLRRGEACGLRWTDLDLENGVLNVRWQITQAGGQLHQGPPKSKAGQRQIAVDSDTVKQLRAHKARQAGDRLTLGAAWVDSGFVFTANDGRPLHPAEVTEQFHWLSMEADLPPIRLHDLRHVAASLMLAAGHDIKVVQHILGHADSSLTRNTYQSVFTELDRQSAEDVASILRPGRGKPRLTGWSRQLIDHGPKSREEEASG